MKIWHVLICVEFFVVCPLLIYVARNMCVCVQREIIPAHLFFTISFIIVVTIIGGQTVSRPRTAIVRAHAPSPPIYGFLWVLLPSLVTTVKYLILQMALHGTFRSFLGRVWFSGNTCTGIMISLEAGDFLLHSSSSLSVVSGAGAGVSYPVLLLQEQVTWWTDRQRWLI